MLEKKIYLIYWDSIDDGCEIKGYIYGTEEEAAAYCEKINKDNKYRYEDFWYEELDCLNPQK